MKALIHELEGLLGVGMLDVAGRPLLCRQLQLLRERGIEDVVVEVCDGAEASARAAWLLSDDPLVSRVIVIPSATPLGARELARRAGLEADELYLALPADTLLSTSAALDRPMRARLTAPGALRIDTADVVIERSSNGPLLETQTLAGWGARITDVSSAHELACAALEGLAPGIMLHAAEARPGVWLARGARILEGAVVHPPVLLGVDALVMPRAQLGPRAVLGDRAVIDRDAVVVDAAVAPDVIVGEGTTVRQVRAEAHGMTHFADASRTSVVDAWALTSRKLDATPLASRAAALVLLLLLSLPWLLTALAKKVAGKPSVHTIRSAHAALRVGKLGVSWLDAVPALVDALQGRRDLIGIADEKALEIAYARARKNPPRAGALDISRALAPNASTSTLLRMWHWYRAHKTPSLDRDLWAER